MKRIIFMFIIIFLLFTLVGCSLFNSESHSANSQKTGFEAEVRILGEHQTETYGMTMLTKSYDYDIIFYGYMEPDATYTLKIQIGFYADNIFVKSVEHIFNCHG